jgi:hypothetical protein
MSFTDTKGYRAEGTRKRTPPGPATASRRLEEHRLALQRLEAKQQIIQELVHGRVQLLEAATRFQTVSRQSAETWREPVVSEHLCRTLIGWAHLALSDRPEVADAVSERLEAELNDYLQRQANRSSSTL